MDKEFDEKVRSNKFINLLYKYINSSLVLFKDT
jgi:hypothetical protein